MLLRRCVTVCFVHLVRPQDVFVARLLRAHKSDGATCSLLTRLGATSCDRDALASLNMVSCLRVAVLASRWAVGRDRRTFAGQHAAVASEEDVLCSDKIYETDRKNYDNFVSSPSNAIVETNHLLDEHLLRIGGIQQSAKRSHLFWSCMNMFDRRFQICQ